MRAIRRQIIGSKRGIANSVAPITRDPHWDKVVSLLHFDGVDGTTDTILHDEKGVEWSLIPSVVAKDDEHAFGGSGAYFSGSGAALVGPPLLPSTGDWTLEIRFKSNPGYTNGRILSQNSRSAISANRILVQQSEVNQVNVGHNNGSSWIWLIIDFIPNTEGYNSLMLVREGNRLRGSVNGSSIVSTAEIPGLSFAQVPFVIGMYSNESHLSFVGTIDEFRITGGVARYTEDFTPPTEPFPNS